MLCVAFEKINITEKSWNLRKYIFLKKKQTYCVSFQMVTMKIRYSSAYYFTILFLAQVNFTFSSHSFGTSLGGKQWFVEFSL